MIGVKLPLDARLVERLYRQAKAGRWRTPVDDFARAIEASVERGLGGPPQDSRALERYLASLHLEDLALACACAAGHDEAWSTSCEQRPCSIGRRRPRPTGGARELADSYADLFESGSGAAPFPFRYLRAEQPHMTWLRAVLAQRHVDRLRANARLEPLPDQETRPIAAPAETGILTGSVTLT